MSLFNNKDTAEKWEKKYFSLLDEHDAQAKAYQENEALLCKTINRLSLATTGFNSELDPYLTRIRKQLKNGLKSEKLKQVLEELSNALITFDESSVAESSKDPRLLVEFLNRQFPHRQAELERIYRRYQDTQPAQIQDLMLALHEMVDEEQSVVTEIQQLSMDEQTIRARLMHLLECTEIPETFSEDVEQLKIRLQNNTEAFPAILEAALALLLSIKKQFQSEQQTMAQFLATLTEQLSETGQQVNSTLHASQQARPEKNTLDQFITRQIHDLRHDSIQATQLEALQQLLNSGLDRIIRQLQVQQQQEQEEHDKHSLTLQLLAAKIQRLEAESCQIKSKFAQARDKAFHDPLTGLPNRLAYDDRLTLEMQRHQRQRTTLSLVIWDIDNCKKINASFGHKAGDNTLKIIARLLEQNCRGTDFLSRFGGDEFITLMTDSDAQAALTSAEKLRRLIANTGFNSNGKKIAITISCGITEYSTDDNESSVFKRAEMALRRAKNNGRNCCVVG